MPEMIPTFQKGVRLEITSQLDNDSSVQALINNFKQFSGFVVDTTQGLVKREADERKDIIKYNVSRSYQQFAQSSLLLPDQNKALSEYDIKAKAYGQELLSQTDQFNKSYVKNLVDYYANEHRTPIIKNAILQNKRVQETDFILRVSQSTEDAISAIQNSNHALGPNQFDAADSLHAQQIKMMEEQVKQGNMTPSTFVATTKSLRKQFTTEKILKKYKDAVEEGRPQQYLTALIKTNIPGFTEADKAALFLQINKINDEHLIEYGLTHKKLEEQKKQDIKNIEENGALPNILLREINTQVNPEDSSQYEKEQLRAQTIFSIRKAAQYSTPAQIQELKDKLKPTDPDDPGYQDAKYIYDRAFSAIDKDQKIYRDDPMAFDKNIPFVDAISRDYQLSKDVNAVGTNEVNSPLNSVVTKPWDSLIYHQQNRGLSIFGDKSNRVKLLENLTAQDYLRQIEQGNARQKIEIFNKLFSEFDGGLRYNLVIKQLQDTGLNNKMGFLALFDPNDPNAQIIADAMTIPTKDLGAALKSKDDSAYKNVNIKIANAVYNGSGGTANYKNYLDSASAYAGGKSEEFLGNIEEVTQSLAYHYMNIGIANSVSDAVSRAQNTIANRYTYTTLHNQIVNIPKQYDTDTIKRYAIEQEKKLKDFPFVVTKTTQGGTLRPEQASELDKDLIMKGHWVGGSNDHGLVWVDFNGRLPVDKEGHPFYFSFDDAQFNFKTVHPHEIKNAFPSFIESMSKGMDSRLIDLLREQT